MNCKGTILEIQKDTVVVFTEDCKFIHIKKQPNMFIGQQITTNPWIKYTNLKNKQLISALTAIMAAALFIICIISPFKSSMDTYAYAYVDLDMNYSLSLDINRKGQVIKFKANDKKTLDLIQDIDTKNKNLNEVIISLLNKEKENPHSMSSKYLLVSASLQAKFFENDKNIEKEQQHLKTLMDSLQNAITAKVTEPKTIKIIYSTASNKKIASELSISMFRYYVYSKLKAISPTLTLEEVKKKSEEELLSLLDTPSSTTDNSDNNQKNNEPQRDINGTNNSNKSNDRSNDQSKNKSDKKSDENSNVNTPKPSTATESTNWQLNANYPLGTVVTYEGIYYKCIQEHTSCEGWDPPVAPSLWERILSTEDEGQWFSNVFYPVNSIVIYANLIFIISYFFIVLAKGLAL